MPVLPCALNIPHAAQNLKDAKWSPAPPLLPKGAEIAVLDGNPTKAAPYAVRLKFPANYAIPAHSHPTDEHVVVTSGVLVFGMGDELEKHSSSNSKLTVGGFVVAAANVNHFAFTRDEETTIVLYGVGTGGVQLCQPERRPAEPPQRREAAVGVGHARRAWRGPLAVASVSERAFMMRFLTTLAVAVTTVTVQADRTTRSRASLDGIDRQQFRSVYSRRPTSRNPL